MLTDEQKKKQADCLGSKPPARIVERNCGQVRAGFSLHGITALHAAGIR